MKKQVKPVIENEKEKIQKILEEAVEANHISRKDVPVLLSKIKAKINEVNKRSDNYVAKEYATLEFGLAAYLYVLENGASADEALEYACSVYNKPEEFIKKVKHLPYFYSKKTVEMADRHPKQQQMIKNKTLVKREVSSSTTISVLLNKLVRSMDLEKRLTELEDTVEQQGKELTILKIKTALQDKDIGKVKEILGVGDSTPQETVVHLYESHLDPKSISEYLDIPIRSVYRYIQKAKKTYKFEVK